MLIKWDFHKQNPDWIGRFGFVYTNSLDHSYNPGLAVKILMAQLKPGGKLIIHDNGEMEYLRNEIFNAADCSGLSHEELLDLLKEYNVEFHKTNYKKRGVYICSLRQS